MKLSSLASSSEGNCIYVGTKKTNVLVDCGVSAKRIENSLSELDLTVPEFDGILITHEHTDHIKGLGVIARRYGLPIFATGKTIDAIFDYKNLGKVDKSLFHSIEADKPFEIGDMKVNASHIWHDAADPVCYSFYSEEGAKASIATDLGDYDEYLVEPLAQVMMKLGVNRGMVVFGQDKLDEISMSAPTSVCEIKDGWFQSYEITPEQFGYTRCSKEDLAGGTPAENAEITKAIVNGNEKGPKRQAVCMNAGAALYIAGKAESLEAGVRKAENLIDSGAAAAKLAEFIKLSNEI